MEAIWVAFCRDSFDDSGCESALFGESDHGTGHY